MSYYKKYNLLDNNFKSSNLFSKQIISLPVYPKLKNKKLILSVTQLNRFLMKVKKILLVGGCGFIGHNLAVKLKNEGHNVTVVDSLSVNNLLSFTDKDIVNKKLYVKILNNRIDLLNQNGIDLIIEDSKNHHQMSKIFDKIKPDTVIHLAAVSHTQSQIKNHIPLLIIV